MDKSKEHIAMADCPEIQDGWEPQDGDFVYYNCNSEPETICFSCVKKEVYEKDKKRGKCVHLPRQDQYQDMLGDKYCIHDMFLRFMDFVAEHAGCHAHEERFKTDMAFDTAGQLWCGFYMQEAHEKVRRELDGKYQWIKYTEF